MSIGKKIAFCIIFIGIIFTITLLLCLKYKPSDAVFSIILGFGALLETVLLIFSLDKERRISAAHGNIIYRFSKQNNKKDIWFSIIFAAETICFLYEFVSHLKLVIFLGVWMLLMMTLTALIPVLSKRGISEVGIDKLLWHEIEFVQLDKENKSIKFKARNWTRVAVRRIMNNDWDSDIENFININSKVLR